MQLWHHRFYRWCKCIQSCYSLDEAHEKDQVLPSEAYTVSVHWFHSQKQGVKKTGTQQCDRIWHHVKKAIPKSVNSRSVDGHVNIEGIMSYVYAWIWRRQCKKTLWVSTWRVVCQVSVIAKFQRRKNRKQVLKVLQGLQNSNTSGDPYKGICSEIHSCKM